MNGERRKTRQLKAKRDIFSGLLVALLVVLEGAVGLGATELLG